MAKCAKCTKVINKKSAGLQCGRCNKWLHASCESLTTEQLNTLTAMDTVDWKCKSCSGQLKQKRISMILPDEDEENSDSEVTGPAIQSVMMQEIRRQIRETIQEEIKRSLQFFSDKFDEFQEMISKYEEKIKVMDKQYKDLTSKYTHIKNKTEFIEQKLNTLEQMGMNNKLEICGIDKQQNENLMDIATKISDKLETESKCIMKAYRKQSKPTDAQKRNSSTIVITLNEDQRDIWLEAAKKKTITARDIDREGNTRIYLREALSSTTAHLLWRAKSELKLKNIVKFVWCKRGNVLIRKTENDKIYVLRSEEDIKKWIQDQHKQ